MPSIDYKVHLYEQLRDAEHAAGYLTACYEEGPDAFLLGLRDVTEANGIIPALTAKTSLSAASLYSVLFENEDVRFLSITLVLDLLGFEMKLVPKRAGTKRSDST